MVVRYRLREIKWRVFACENAQVQHAESVMRLARELEFSFVAFEVRETGEIVLQERGIDTYCRYCGGGWKSETTGCDQQWFRTSTLPRNLTTK